MEREGAMGQETKKTTFNCSLWSYGFILVDSFNLTRSWRIRRLICLAPQVMPGHQDNSNRSNSGNQASNNPYGSNNQATNNSKPNNNNLNVFTNQPTPNNQNSNYSNYKTNQTDVMNQTTEQNNCGSGHK